MTHELDVQFCDACGGLREECDDRCVMCEQHVGHANLVECDHCGELVCSMCQAHEMDGTCVTWCKKCYEYFTAPEDEALADRE